MSSKSKAVIVLLFSSGFVFGQPIPTADSLLDRFNVDRIMLSRYSCRFKMTNTVLGYEHDADGNHVRVLDLDENSPKFVGTYGWACDKDKFSSSVIDPLRLRGEKASKMSYRSGLEKRPISYDGSEQRIELKSYKGVIRSLSKHEGEELIRYSRRLNPACLFYPMGLPPRSSDHMIFTGVGVSDWNGRKIPAGPRLKLSIVGFVTLNGRRLLQVNEVYGYWRIHHKDMPLVSESDDPSTWSHIPASFTPECKLQTLWLDPEMNWRPRRVDVYVQRTGQVKTRTVVDDASQINGVWFPIKGSRTEFGPEAVLRNPGKTCTESDYKSTFIPKDIFQYEVQNVDFSPALDNAFRLDFSHMQEVVDENLNPIEVNVQEVDGAISDLVNEVME